MLQAELQLNIHQLNTARESHKTKKKKKAIQKKIKLSQQFWAKNQKIKCQ
jgi:hypothetical protein